MSVITQIGWFKHIMTICFRSFKVFIWIGKVVSGVFWRRLTFLLDSRGYHMLFSLQIYPQIYRIFINSYLYKHQCKGPPTTGHSPAPFFMKPTTTITTHEFRWAFIFYGVLHRSTQWLDGAMWHGCVRVYICCWVPGTANRARTPPYANACNQPSTKESGLLMLLCVCVMLRYACRLSSRTLPSVSNTNIYLFRR